VIFQGLDAPLEGRVPIQGALRPARPVHRLCIQPSQCRRQRSGHAAVGGEPVGRVLTAPAHHASAIGQMTAQIATVPSTTAVATWPRWTACTTATTTAAAATSPSKRFGWRRPAVPNPKLITHRDTTRQGSASHIVSSAKRAALVA
jgi:hypothetical protein